MGDAGLRIGVECHVGYGGEYEPWRLCIGRRWIAVSEIVDRWPAPDHRYFKLRCEDGGIYLLRHDEVRSTWELTVYDSGAREETRLSST
ncbi:hypothetical protein [Thioalkalivibrio thiocyanodenitrificans]|uniref:hypothetical protein n=1 Tax=Thioalkalivibrio thiocyanodenitrificans TaxID=243063 RepID=UPI00035FFF6B|nr:hypothetical protein [Thioalkalivibrio thiocyanodenitrificans]